MKRAITAWLITVIAIYVLYVGVSMAFFNRLTPYILGMPPLIFWFTLVPVVTPLLMGWLYLNDKKTNPQWDEEEHR